MHSPYQVLWIPADAGMTVGVVLVARGGFETRPYQVVASIPFNSTVLNH